MAVSKSYFDSYLQKYKEYYEKYFKDVDKAYKCTQNNPCSNLSGALVDIRDSIIKPLTDFNDWDDNVKTEFVENINACNRQLNSLIDNIDTNFTNIEKNYKYFFEELGELKVNYENLAKQIELYPKESDYQKTERDSKGKETEVLDTAAFNKAVDSWFNACQAIVSLCDTNVTNGDSYFLQLEKLNGTIFPNVNKLSGVDILKAFDLNDVLGLDEGSLNSIVNFCLRYGISQRGSKAYGSQCSQLARCMGFILTFGASNLPVDSARVVNSRNANDDNIQNLLLGPGQGWRGYSCTTYSTFEEAKSVIQSALEAGVYPTMSVWNATKGSPGYRHEVTVVKIENDDIYVWDPANNYIKKVVYVPDYNDCPNVNSQNYDPSIRYVTALNFSEGSGFQVSVPKQSYLSKYSIGGNSLYLNTSREDGSQRELV